METSGDGIMRYLIDSDTFHEGQWINPNGVNEWDELGDNPISMEAIREEDNVKCCYIDGRCVNIGELSDDFEINGNETFEYKKVRTNPKTGRYVV